VICWAMRILDTRRLFAAKSGFLYRGLFLIVLGLAVGLPSASADLVPTPPPECENKPDGTFCSLGDGTAGACVTQQDTRRPGRSYRGCKKDLHECDRLEVGAVCHGYLGKPAHCREFSNAETKQRWRTCQVDDAAAPPADSTASPAIPSAAPAATESTPAPAKKPKGLLGCSQTREASPTGLSLLAIGIALFALRLRRRLLATR